jgi:hypothetical protein
VSAMGVEVERRSGWLSWCWRKRRLRLPPRSRPQRTPADRERGTAAVAKGWHPIPERSGRPRGEGSSRPRIAEEKGGTEGGSTYGGSAAEKAGFAGISYPWPPRVPTPVKGSLTDSSLAEPQCPCDEAM